MMKKVIVLTTLLVIVAAVVVGHAYMSDRGRWTTEPEFAGLERTLTDNELVSLRDPAVRMRFDPSFRHLGGQKFVLYGVADTEQHFFIETTAEDKLKSLYWVQFEAYQEGNSYKYDYEDSPGRLQLNDFDFYVDTAAIESNPEKRRRGSDGSLARQFVQSKGYDFPQEFAYARLVHLTDASRRKELMVIFIEDLAPLGLKVADLEVDGRPSKRWPGIEKQHLDKVRDTLQLFAP